MPIDGRGRVLGMEFGVGDLLLRYDFFFILLEQTAPGGTSFYIVYQDII
jgi:hypothetical protein